MTLHGGDERAGWEVVKPPIPTRLRPFVESWTGYREWSPTPVQRIEPATSFSMLIFEFGAPIRVFDALGSARAHRGGFFAGLDERPTLTEFERSQAGVQVTLTPTGAAAFVAQPMRELAGNVVGVDELGVRRSFFEELAEAPNWSTRFRAVRHELERRFMRAAAISNVVKWALARIDAASGFVRISELSDELGYSRKHLHARFTCEVGLPPKRYAELKRFERLANRLRATERPDLATLALDLGYADQSHLSRDAKRFAGMTASAIHRLSNDSLSAAIHSL